MSLAEVVEVFRKNLAPAPFILCDNNLKAGHPSVSSVRASCLRNGENLFYIVGSIRFKNVLLF